MLVQILTQRCGLRYQDNGYDYDLRVKYSNFLNNNQEETFRMSTSNSNLIASQSFILVNEASQEGLNLQSVHIDEIKGVILK